MDFDHFVTDVLAEGHIQSIFLLLELESRFGQECLDILQLGIVFIFVLNFTIERFDQLLSGSLDSLKG